MLNYQRVDLLSKSPRWGYPLPHWVINMVMEPVPKRDDPPNMTLVPLSCESWVETPIMRIIGLRDLETHNLHIFSRVQFETAPACGQLKYNWLGVKNTFSNASGQTANTNFRWSSNPLSPRETKWHFSSSCASCNKWLISWAEPPMVRFECRVLSILFSSDGYGSTHWLPPKNGWFIILQILTPGFVRLISK